MTDVVHQDCRLNGFCLGVKDKDALLLERKDGLAHQVEGSQ